MAEKFNEQSNERISTPEISAERYEQAAEQYEKKAEKSDIESGEKKAEKAKKEALEQAVSVERGSAERKKTTSKTTKRRGISKKERDASFNQRMSGIRSEMSLPERTFSRVIHNKVVEKTSEVVGATIARPNAILSGAVVAFIAVLGIYLLAKNLGYPLSGFETIGAFIAGWVIGLLYDFFKVMITGRK